LIELGVPRKKVILIPNFININNFDLDERKNIYLNLKIFQYCTSPGKIIGLHSDASSRKRTYIFWRLAKNVLNDFLKPISY